VSVSPSAAGHLGGGVLQVLLVRVAQADHLGLAERDQMAQVDHAVPAAADQACAQHLGAPDLAARGGQGAGRRRTTAGIRVAASAHLITGAARDCWAPGYATPALTILLALAGCGMQRNRPHARRGWLGRHGLGLRSGRRRQHGGRAGARPPAARSRRRGSGGGAGSPGSGGSIGRRGQHGGSGGGGSGAKDAGAPDVKPAPDAGGMLGRDGGVNAQICHDHLQGHRDQYTDAVKAAQMCTVGAANQCQKSVAASLTSRCGCRSR
jgi:hypothetical protein